MKLILIGFGVVGQGFAEILRDKGSELQRKHNFTAEIVGVVTASKGSLYRSSGLDITSLLEAAEGGSFDDYPSQPGLRRDLAASEMIAAREADALVEVSPTNLETAQPALEYCHLALDAGMHLALANKGPVALDYATLREKARDKSLQMRYEATVMAGTPTMHLAEDALAGCVIRSARGILNGTTNYILTQMETGMSYDDALAQAQELGYAETDPSGDVEGWDAAGKLLILGNALFGRGFALADLEVSGITTISAGDIADAKAAGQRYKLIASATPAGGSVTATRLPLDDPLANVAGSTNAITLETDLMGDITLIGAGAGKLETGYAILSDLMAIERTAHRP
ncbi:MAG: homoserine dehydrogenase [Chloroflexi bacterium]|nr:homoserine dehydrogenase [Chloroflexota bacterium]